MEKQNSIFVLDSTKIYIFLVLACLLVYANSLSGDFVFDDTAQIVNNPALNSWQNIINAFTTDVWAFQKATAAKGLSLPYYRPLFTVYLTIGYQLFGLWQQGWHLLNLAIYIGATILVYLLFCRLSEDNRRLSFIGSLFFALIPVHVESISWISGIPDPLSALFYIPSIIFYINWRENADKKQLIFSLIFFFLALLCKETPIVLPAVLLIWELTLNRQDKTSNIFTALKSLIIFAVPVLIYFIIRLSVLGKISWQHPSATQTPIESVYATIPFVLISYFKNIIFPFNLSLIYDVRFVSGAGDILLWIPVIILGLTGFLLYFFRQKLTPLMWLAIGLFFIPILPVLNLQVFHYQFIIQDRYLYLPSIGFVLFLACLLEKLWTSEQKSFQQLAIGIVSLICISYAVGTILQNRIWQSEIDLWTRAANTAPNWWANYYNLGLAHLENKDYEKAANEFETSLKYESVDRKDSLIYNNLGLAEKDLGNPDEAKKNYLKSLEFDPKSIEAVTNLGVIYFDRGNYIEAENQFKKGLQIDASNPFVNYNLARTWEKFGRHKEALNIYEKLLQTEKLNPELMYDAAISYAAVGNSEKAKTLLNEANKITKDEKLKQQLTDEMQKLK